MIEWLTLKNAIHINNVSAEFSFSNCHRTVLKGKWRFGGALAILYRRKPMHI